VNDVPEPGLSDDELRAVLEAAGWRVETKLLATRPAGDGSECSIWDSECCVWADTMSGLVAGCLDFAPFFVEDEEPA
jgi:hypothetical protein